jgi:hypothetical protein
MGLLAALLLATRKSLEGLSAGSVFAVALAAGMLASPPATTFG